MIRIGVVVSLLLPLAAPARTVAAERFGQAGSVAITNAAGFSLSYQSAQSPFPSSTAAAVNLSGDYFFPKGISLGGAASLTWASMARSVTSAGNQSLSAVPRLGYVLPLSARFSLWPQGSVRFWWARGRTDNPGITMSAAIPLVFEPSTHFVVGFGPGIDHTLADGYYSTARNLVGLTSFLGGWF